MMIFRADARDPGNPNVAAIAYMPPPPNFRDWIIVARCCFAMNDL
jgi:hypothetical protein